jgi:hypothetical protein
LSNYFLLLSTSIEAFLEINVVGGNLKNGGNKYVSLSTFKEWTSDMPAGQGGVVAVIATNGICSFSNHVSRYLCGIADTGLI